MMTRPITGTFGYCISPSVRNIDHRYEAGAGATGVLFQGATHRYITFLRYIILFSILRP
jgi:hypothetical protein